MPLRTAAGAPPPAFPPDSAPALRKFTSDEAAQRLGVKDAPLRKLSLDGNGPAPADGATARWPTSVHCGASGISWS
jgi:chromosome partitioning protein